MKRSILDQLMVLEANLSKKMKHTWNRSLPFNELLVDRWKTAKKMKFGKNSNVYNNCYVFGNPKVGKNTWIGPFTILDGTGGLTIGDNCSISAGAHLYTHDTVAWAISGGKIKNPAKKSVTIGNCCYIGPYAVIVKGVTIGDHALIGACSLVNKNIPAYSIAVGTPAKIIGKIKLLRSGRIKINYTR